MFTNDTFSIPLTSANSSPESVVADGASTASAVSDAAKHRERLCRMRLDFLLEPVPTPDNSSTKASAVENRPWMPPSISVNFKNDAFNSSDTTIPSTYDLLNRSWHGCDVENQSTLSIDELSRSAVHLSSIAKLNNNISSPIDTVYSDCSAVNSTTTTTTVPTFPCVGQPVGQSTTTHTGLSGCGTCPSVVYANAPVQSYVAPSLYISPSPAEQEPPQMLTQPSHSSYSAATNAAFLLDDRCMLHTSRANKVGVSISGGGNVSDWSIKTDECSAMVHRFTSASPSLLDYASLVGGVTGTKITSANDSSLNRHGQLNDSTGNIPLNSCCTTMNVHSSLNSSCKGKPFKSDRTESNSKRITNTMSNPLEQYDLDVSEEAKDVYRNRLYADSTLKQKSIPHKSDSCRNVDNNLSKISKTIRDFNSHLSQIDSTLGRMGNIGSLSRFLETVQDNNDDMTDKRDWQPTPAVQCSSASSSDSAGSDECSRKIDHSSGRTAPPSLPEQHQYHATDATPLSSSLGASLSTLSSSLWSSLGGSLHYARSNSPGSDHVGATNNGMMYPIDESFDQPSSSHRMTTSSGLSNFGGTEPTVANVERVRTNANSVKTGPAGRRLMNHHQTSKHWDHRCSVSKTDKQRNGKNLSSFSSSSSAPGTAQAEAAGGEPTVQKTHKRNSVEMSASSASKSPVSTVCSLHSSVASLKPSASAHSHSSTEDSVQLTERGDNLSVSNIMELETNLLNQIRSGREADAKVLIRDLLSHSVSRQTLRQLVEQFDASAGGDGGGKQSNSWEEALSDRTGDASRDDSRRSLLRLALSLAAIHDDHNSRQLPTGSLPLLTVGKKPQSRSESLSAMSPSGRLNMPTVSAPSPSLYGASSTSLSSSRVLSGPNIKLVKWPSEEADQLMLEEYLPPMRPRPSPHLPRHPKLTVLPTTDVTYRLDCRAVEMAANDLHLTFSDLVANLTDGLTDDVQIVRVLFAWTVAIDLRYTEYDPVAPVNSLIGLLRRVRSGQSCRNELLYKLCRYSGIHCQVITGCTKETAYFGPHHISTTGSGRVNSSRLVNASWLAVYVSDGWRFVDPDRASRASTLLNIGDKAEESVVDTRDSSPSSSLCCDEFYFLTDPEQHIFEHFPDHKAWQLLRRPLTLDRFLRLPLLKSPFFNANLSFKKTYSDILVTSNGQVTVKLCMPQFVGISCTLENQADRSMLRGLCLVEVLPSMDVVRIQASPSQPGKYILRIYVSQDWRREDLRELACVFQVHCSEHNYSRLIAMGRIPEIGFLGPTPAAGVYGVSMLAVTASRNGRAFIVETGGSGTVRLPFAVSPGLKICHQLKSFDRPGLQMIDCDSYALLQMRSFGKFGITGPSTSTSNAQYHVRMPIEGFYYLTVYASSHDASDTDNLECVQRVMIDLRKGPATCPSSVVPFPRQTLWWVYCSLIEPLCQQLKVGRTHTFRLLAPRFDSMAIVINDDPHWQFLRSTSSGHWVGKVAVGDYLGHLSIFGRLLNNRAFANDNKAPLCSDNVSISHGDEEAEESYVKLLDYVIVE